MSTRLTPLREAIISAAADALAAAQLQLSLESEEAFRGQWAWFKPGSGDSGKIELRDINDTETLMNSIQFLPVTIGDKSITTGLTWQAANEYEYAALVHNGQKNYFDEKNGLRDYAARPWTFLLAPQEQRDTSQLNSVAGKDPETLSEVSWDAAMEKFRDTLKAKLAQRFKVVG